jgi:5-methyltetrahydropteroyltriglutamate--homocysteine methyltransferase
MPAVSPENAEHGKLNEYYRTKEEFSFAIADALNEEYRAIVDAGFLVQIDDPQLITYFNRNPDKSLAECRKWGGPDRGHQPRAKGYPGREGPLSHLL